VIQFFSCFLQACFSAEGSLAEAGQQLEALKELCDTLSPEDAHMDKMVNMQPKHVQHILIAIWEFNSYFNSYLRAHTFTLDDFLEPSRNDWKTETSRNQTLKQV